MSATSFRAWRFPRRTALPSRPDGSGEPSYKTLLVVGVFVAVLLLVGQGTALQARTIILTEEDTEQVAMISSQSPRSSWGNYDYGNGVTATYYVDLYSYKSFLMRYPLDKIPKGMRITNAEWVIPVHYLVPAREQKMYVRRLLAEWGPGVCHLYRMTRPKKAAWATVGGRGSSDRAAKASAVVRVTTAEEQVVNVTEDVELWYSGAAPNYGWMLHIEDEGCLIRATTPQWGTTGVWKLRISYEPSDDQ